MLEKWRKLPFYQKFVIIMQILGLALILFGILRMHFTQKYFENLMKTPAETQEDEGRQSDDIYIFTP